MKHFLLVVIAIFVSGCTTLEVQVDYDAKYDFKRLSTFSVVYIKKDDNKDFLRSRLSKVLERHIEKKGYQKVAKSQADFYFTVHLDIQKNTQVETNYETMGIRPNRFYIPTRPGINNRLYMRDTIYEPDVRVTTHTYEYEDGKLVIELFDVKLQEIVWQGIAKDELSSGMSQEEKSVYINKVITELFKDFPSK
ncbi:MAG: DUF4136 domain-containing protein [Sulfurimonadaceae bacterium]|jgi:hypothetical protein|nr:DUF4136 domain-containing protein [Sulfurimonadaceae bacterium]